MEIDIIEDSRRLFLWALGGVLSLVIGFVFYSFTGAFVVSLFFYYGARPIHTRLQNRFPTYLSAAFSLVLLFLPVALLVGYFLSVGTRELLTFISHLDSQQFKELISPYINYNALVSLQNALASQSPSEILNSNGFIIVNSFIEILLNYVGFVSIVFINVFTIVILSYYLLKDDSKLLEKLDTQFTVSPTTKTFLQKIDKDFQTIFFGNILNAILTAVIGVSIYSILEFLFASQTGVSIQYPVLIGLLCGLGSLIPVVGMKIVYFPVSFYLFLSSAYTPESSFIYPVIFIVVSAIIVDGIPDLVLRPYVSGRNLHLGLVMLSYIFGPLLFGWYGLFLGPMILVVVTHFYNIVLPRLLNKNKTLQEFTE